MLEKAIEFFEGLIDWSVITANYLLIYTALSIVFGTATSFVHGITSKIKAFFEK